MVKIGIIGGSGLDNPNILKDAYDKNVETPFGTPSSALKIGSIAGVQVVLLARHGRDHSIMPTLVNNQANIFALKQEGCTHILASTAVGSLREEIKPGDLVFIDQFIDRTTKRKQTFYEQGKVSHIPMADPFCQKIRNTYAQVAKELQLRYHEQGTVITIEGPRFSSRAESHLFRSWGADVINMSTVPEAVLAREAGLCYAAVAMSTDYDSWRSSEEKVSWEEVLKVFKQNAQNVIELFINTIPRIAAWQCSCQEDFKTAVVNGKPREEFLAQPNHWASETTETFDLKTRIRTVPNWPKPGIMFRDITTLLENPQALAYTVKKFKERYQNKGITKVAGIDARGFIFAALLAQELKLPLVLLRKKGKLPHQTISESYNLEYGSAALELHKSSIQAGDKVLILDDLLATGGTALAAAKLIEQLGARIESLAFVIDLPDLKGAEKLRAAGHNVFSLVEFEGE